MTLPEVIVVITILGIIVGITVPRFSTARESAGRVAARQQLQAAFSAARSAAIQKGKTATLTLTDSSASVTAVSTRSDSGFVIWGPTTFRDPVPSTVTPLDAAPLVLTYDARGLLTPVASGTLKYEITVGGLKDTLCLTASGMLMPRGCVL